jgi:hypothetical protein
MVAINQSQRRHGKSCRERDSNFASSKGSTGIVPFRTTTPTPLEHRGHTMLVFSFMVFNLRDVLQSLQVWGSRFRPSGRILGNSFPLRRI